MDPNAVQQLLGMLQQMTTLIQGMAGGDADAEAVDPAAADPMGDPTGGDPAAMDDPNMNTGEDPSMMGDDPMAMGDDGGDSLHDRVSQLEDHTGLQKSAGATLLKRITALEEALLGVEYEGSAVARVNQLTKTAGLLRSSNASTTQSSGASDDEAPDEIPLDALIKTAIQVGVQQGIQQLAETSQQQQLPSPTDLRQTQPIQRQPARRGQTTLQTDTELAKTAASFGWKDEELDQEVGLGDVLLMQYNANQNGSTLFDDDDE